MLPSGAVGENCIAEATKLIRLFNSGSKFKPIALTNVIIYNLINNVILWVVD